MALRAVAGQVLRGAAVVARLRLALVRAVAAQVARLTAVVACAGSGSLRAIAAHVAGLTTLVARDSSGHGQKEREFVKENNEGRTLEIA